MRGRENVVPRFSPILLDFAGRRAESVRTGIESASGLSAMGFRKKTSGGRAYLQIVESRREGAGGGASR